MTGFMRDMEAFQQTFTLSATAPLGMRFWDGVTGSCIADGLSVTAYPSAQPQRRVAAFANRHGVYVLRNLPGLGSVEQGQGDTLYWDTVRANTKRFYVEVVDVAPMRRFQPFSLPVDLPYKGLFKWMSATPAANGEAPVPLFSAPTRTLPGTVAVIRAELWDAATGAPAAWALLAASLAGRLLAQGFADQQGRVLLAFPYPAPVNAAFGAPEVPLTQQQWTVQLHAAYTSLLPAPVVPDLSTTLSQATATLWADAAATQARTELVLKFGQEASFPSVLWIRAADQPR